MSVTDWLLVAVIGLQLVLVVGAWMLWVGTEIQRSEVRAVMEFLAEQLRQVLDVQEATLSETPITRAKAKRIRAAIRRMAKQGKLKQLEVNDGEEEGTGDASP